MKQDYTKKENIRGKRDGDDYESKVLDIARVSRVTKGGKRFSFRATVVLGDKKGKIGTGVAKGKDVAQAVQKATNQARKSLTSINLAGNTIPHEVLYKYKSAIVFLKPAVAGHGVKAGGPVRVIAQLVGIKDLTGKLISKTNNKINNARATLGALKKLKMRVRNQKEKSEVTPDSQNNKS